jgi:predicted dehydrogenase
MAETIRSGAVGEPRLVHLTWYAGHVWPGAWRAWQLDVDRCGGHIVHNGIHALDLLIWLLQDEPLRIFAREIPTWSSVMPTTDSFHILVEFASGALATIEVSYAFAGGAPPLRRIVVAGTGGIASIDSETEPRSTSGTGASFPIRSAADGLVRQFEHFHDILANGVAPITTPTQVRRALNAAFAARQSAITGQPVSLGSAR